MVSGRVVSGGGVGHHVLRGTVQQVAHQVQDKIILWRHSRDVTATGGLRTAGEIIAAAITMRR